MSLYDIYENIPALNAEYSNMNEYLAYLEKHDCRNKMLLEITHIMEREELQSILDHYQDKIKYRQSGHVMQGGFGQFVYNVDNLAFYEKFNDEIWQLFYDESQDTGQPTMAIINNIEGMSECVTDCQFKTLLVWEAVFRAANMLMDDTL